MSDHQRHSRVLAELPFDVLLKVLGECDVDGVLNLSAVSTHPSEFILVPDCAADLQEGKRSGRETSDNDSRSSSPQVPSPDGQTQRMGYFLVEI